MIAQEWFSDWFNSPYYYRLYQNRDDQEATLFINQLIHFFRFTPQQRILDLACGKGRHSIYLGAKGFDVTGIDIAWNSIAFAHRFAHERLRFYVHDMREPYPVGKFDYILNLFTSFGYFATEQENIAAIYQASEALVEGGKLIIDFMNTDKVIKNLTSYESKMADGITFEIRKKVEKGFIVKDIDFDTDHGHHHFQECVQVIDQRTFESYFTQLGLKKIHLFGDHFLNPYQKTASDRMIFVVQK